MEEYFIGLNGLETIRGQETQSRGVEAGFKFFVLGLEKWNEIPPLLPDHIQLAEWIEGLRAREADESKGKSKEASLIFRPHIDRLSPNIHYICFRDIDEQRKERPIRFFLTSEVFILLGWNGFSPERLDEWAQRGILTIPLELACTLGLRLLRHHQKNLEIIEDQMDLIEEEILIAPRSWQLNRIITLHRRVLGLKRSLKAHQGVFAQLKNITKVKYGDLHEELMLEMKRAIDNIYQTHEMIESLREAYQAATDNHANDIMKLLTLLATILLPINLLTSFFGMNFEVMPLIHTTYGIVIFYTLSALIVMVVMAYFIKKKWLK
ncbi:CorA family divalent cation transporter [Desulfosporosinus sp. OT]|uniref:CorA family divalent cation transporter n=1 Tax=Desulfosporosinus sp. OT TaxID=913865 RepID=UPI000223A276|nr:CorA family divalent cation transporter [Desulfosporosinus sp. OT]EGW40746.1 corA-like Mg2+ transporter family protein [Desulfosporosinus sp. OT]